MDITRDAHGKTGPHSQATLRIDPERVSLDSVLITDELARRPSRPPDYEAENRALASLAQEMANSPGNVLHKLVEIALVLCRAHSAGVSMLEDELGNQVFRWNAIAGRLAVYQGGCMARDLSPCATVLDRDSVLLFRYPEHHYHYPMPIDPPMAEALLIPFHIAGKPVGTIWVIAHDEDRKFDAEDARVMQALAKFASSAFQVLHSLEALTVEMAERNETEKELRASEEALRESKDWLRTVIENLAEGLVVVDPNGETLDWNQAALHMHGYSKRGEEPVLFSAAVGLFELHRLDGTPVPVEQWPVPRLLRGEEMRDYELAFRRKADGRERIFSYGGTLVRNGAGQAVMGLLTIRDVTGLKMAQQALIRAEKLASVGRMAATIAHEINNPLAAAMNALYIAGVNPSLDDVARKHLQIAGAELDRVAHMTKQTLGFYREGGSPTGLDVPEIVHGVLDIYRPKLQNKSVSVQTRFRSTARVQAIEGELRQVFSNLVANSIDAMGANGVLQVHTSDPPPADEHSMVRLTIADTGAGISPENLKHIFEPFFTTKKAVGTGLGLWVTSELVKKHGGRIRVRSQLGKGTVFSIWLLSERRQQKRDAE